MLFCNAKSGNINVMTAKDLWADVFQAIKNMERIESDLKDAYESRDKEIANIYKNGVPAATIARRVGLSGPTVHKILKQQNAK